VLAVQRVGEHAPPGIGDGDQVTALGRHVLDVGPVNPGMSDLDAISSTK